MSTTIVFVLAVWPRCAAKPTAMTMPRWRASFTRSRPNSSITGIMQHGRKPDAISSPLRHRLHQPDRDGAKSSLTLSIFSGEDHPRNA
jgi:hypothetical protein